MRTGEDPRRRVSDYERKRRRLGLPEADVALADESGLRPARGLRCTAVAGDLERITVPVERVLARIAVVDDLAVRPEWRRVYAHVPQDRACAEERQVQPVVLGRDHGAPLTQVPALVVAEGKQRPM